MTETALDVTPRSTGHGFDAAELGRVWLRVTADDEAAIRKVCAEHRIEFPATLEGVGEDEDFDLSQRHARRPRRR